MTPSSSSSSLFAPVSRRILCVRLRNWPIDRLCRRRAGLRRSPLALVGEAANRRFVAAVCGRARSLGVRPGIDQAEALAVCPSLACLPYDPVADARGLRSLGRWMMRFTPVVAVAGGPDDPLGTPDALVLDVTGCERVFHGLRELVRQVVASLERFQLDARVAVGPNPGAAWAMTFAPGARSPVSRRCDAGDAATECLTSRGAGGGEPDLLASLSDVPCEALRLDDDAVAKLYHLGIRTIGQLLRLPREQLPARFGPRLTLRIDQLLGHTPEPLAPLDPPTVVAARMDFDGVVTSPEAIWAVFRELLGRVITQLLRRGRGVRELDVTFVRAYAPPLLQTVRLSRPSRDPVNLFDLFRCATERMDDRHGHATDEFLGMRLLVRVHEPLGDEQVGLLDGENYAGEQELDRLIERLCARLGEPSVTRAEAVESHVPERAYRRQLARDARARPGGSPKRPARTGAKGKRPGRPGGPGADPHPRYFPAHTRPLYLLPRPLEVRVTVNPYDDQFGQPLQFVAGSGSGSGSGSSSGGGGGGGRVHRLAHVVGPERIGGRWWDGHDKTRDYFDVEDDAGKRFWLFRVNETRRWFLHGQYA